MDGLFGFIAIASLITWIVTRYSFWCLPFVVSIAILAEDNFYPLSYFPMYSDPDESENYFYVATTNETGEMEPIPVRKLTSITAPKVKKMYKSWSRQRADEMDKSDRDLTQEERAEVGRELLTFLNGQAVDRNREMPEPLHLVEVWIVYDNDTGFSETPETVATLETIPDPEVAVR